MQVSVKKIGWLPVVLPAIFALGLPGAPAKADSVANIGHRVVRERILGDAHDRYDVRFATTRVERISPSRRAVLGRGSFNRHGKSTQHFTYHVTVDRRDGSVYDIGYNLL